MRNYLIKPIVALIVTLAISSVLLSQSSTHPGEPKNMLFNPRDLSGVWWVDDPGPGKLLARGRKGDVSKCQTCHVPEHTVPEPPLTPWAKENLVIKDEMSNGMMSKWADSVTIGVQF